LDPELERSIRKRDYRVWEQEGRPEGRALDHWLEAILSLSRESDPAGQMLEEEKLLAGRPDVNFPALLTRDVKGG
jgi:hypothetical protein